MEQHFSEDDLRGIARCHEHDNHGPGDPGHCDPDLATWAIEDLEPNLFLHDGCVGTMEDWRSWLNAEIAMDEDEELHRGWRNLLHETIQEEVVILLRDAKAYIWDGYHRVAASVCTGRKIRAIVGRPVIAAVA